MSPMKNTSIRKYDVNEHRLTIEWDEWSLDFDDFLVVYGEINKVLNFGW